MKKHTFKNQKRKIVPICYRKRSHSNSNTSLSQLLSIGSYKKRINELTKNNRSLAVALQEARCETSYQKDIIKNYAEDHNKIMFARLKLQGMAQTITQLVTDLHEVVNCLDVNWASESNLLQKNGLLRDRMKIKAPTVDFIEEESVLSSENGDQGESSLSNPNEVSSDKAPNVEEGTSEILPSTPANITDLANDLDMPPILFVENSNDKPMEMLSREHKSSRKSIVNQTSLTPELDIDLCVIRKRSSRKQVIIPSSPYSRRSSRKSMFRKSLSIENTTPKTALESTTQRKLILMDHEESCENKNPDSALFNMEENESIRSSSGLQLEEYCGTNEFLGCAFVNMKDRGSKNKNSSSPDAIGVSMALHSEPVVLPTSDFPNDKNIESNHTILSCEDMDLTEVIRPVPQITSDNSFSTVCCPVSHSNLQLNTLKKKEEIGMSAEKIHSENKLCNVAEKVPVLSKDINLNNMEKKNSSNSAINNGKISKKDETSEHTELINEKPSESPLKLRASLNKNNIIYKVFLSSSESEMDSTPIKSESKKKNPKRIHRNTVIFKPKSCKKVSGKKDGSADKSPTKDLQKNKDTENLLSVYDLDVSNSKKPKKSRLKSKPKSSRNKECSKPLSQNCNITKLQGINYKFTKNENPVYKEKVRGLSEIDNFAFKTKPVIHIDETVKQNQSYAISKTAELETETENRQTSTCNGEELSFEIANLKNEALTSKSPKSEVRRVSFASTDLVCNFNKMSVSKTIAGNKKTLRTSKSIVKREDIKQLPIETIDSVQFETNKSFDGMPETLNSQDNLFNFSEETELYTFVLPSKEVETLSSSETTVSLLPTNGDIHSNKKSEPIKPTKRQKVGKLSLKRNKNCQNKPELYVSDKIDKDDIFKEHHSQPSPTLSKHKCSQKDGNLNRSMEHKNSQTLECLQENIKPEISKQLPLASVEAHMLIPIDDIKCATRSRSRSSSSVKHQSTLPSPNKTVKKSSTRRKRIELSPVLKDVINLTEITEGPTKRQSRAVNYKEPSLNKKLRRS